MNLPIDTHVLIWFLNGDPQLSGKARSAIENSGNNKIISIASIWEIAIKVSLKRLKFPHGFQQFLSLIEENGMERVAFKSHAIRNSKGGPEKVKDVE